MRSRNMEEKISAIEKRVGKVEKTLSALPAEPVKKVMLTTEEAARYLGLTVDGLRNLTHRKMIPFYKPNGKNMYFDPDELVAWMRRNHFEPMYDVEEKPEK